MWANSRNSLVQSQHPTSQMSAEQYLWGGGGRGNGDGGTLFALPQKKMQKLPRYTKLPKVGIHNFSLHLCNSTILWTTKLIYCGLKKLCNCDCGSSKFVFCNSATLRSLRQALLLSRPFFSAQDGFKNGPKICIESFVSMETKNFP